MSRIPDKVDAAELTALSTPSDYQTNGNGRKKTMLQPLLYALMAVPALLFLIKFILRKH
jgi:hypothetical protein